MTIEEEALLLSKWLSYTEKEHDYIGENEGKENNLIEEYFKLEEDMSFYKVVESLKSGAIRKGLRAGAPV